MKTLPAGTKSSKATTKDEIPIMYMSLVLTDAKTHYHTTEMECLAVLRCLEEVRWLVQGVQHPVWWDDILPEAFKRDLSILIPDLDSINTTSSLIGILIPSLQLFISGQPVRLRSLNQPRSPPRPKLISKSKLNNEKHQRMEMSILNSVAFTNKMLSREVRALRLRVEGYENLIQSHPDLVAQAQTWKPLPELTPY
ncbi:hypothetical protein N7447_008408 [Penicillium robsamsonii]|uniref:uncharacterized protein n=1 Tax=Penicillium robsamsonii TaxID=1792511 RepID=UPI00254753A0|nr:uncharacterized protein N7447_008408 [Penicillium robsamsonii]KAJ5816175.1 hypothetical protein N7447_008408 [Penicillium robsamsonii]